ncbi:MAG: MFS transporter [Proteobacteria bacterium]|nr:MFS transporter [Pseudomonadota bacterium]MBU1057062.1 MFS transporter [Pseudomonadota bacterium]
MEQNSLSRALTGLLFLAALFFLNFTSRVIFSPLLPFIEEEMGLAHAQSGSFFFFISAGYFVAILSSGFVSARIGHKLTIVFSAIASGVVLFGLGFCTSLFTLRLTLFCLGLASGLYLPSGLVTISRIVAPAYLARGLAIHEIAPNLGFVAAPLLCEILLSFVSWQEVLAWLGIVLIGIGMTYGLSSHGSGERGKAPDLSASGFLLRMGAFWAMCLFFSLGICSTLGIYAMAPLFLVTDHGMDPQEANRLLAFSRTASIFIPLLGGWLGDRFGNRRVMGTVLLITGILTILMAMVGNGIWLMVFVVAQPLFAVCFFPSGFAVLSKLGPPEYGNLAVSLCIPFAFLLGGGVIPTLIGMIGDVASISLGFILAGVALTLGGCFSFFLTFKGENRGEM